MAHGTRSGRKLNDDESTSSIGRQASSKGSSTSGTSTSDTPVLRRSSRETLLPKNNTQRSPSSTQRSEQLEKPIPVSPPAKKKSEIVENKSTPSPLRRSQRGLTHSSSSSASKTSNSSLDSSLMKDNRETKENNVKESTIETKVLHKSENKDVEHGQAKQKRLKSRAYIASLLKHAKAAGHVHKQSDDLSPQPWYNAITIETDHVSEMIHVDGTALKAPELTTSTSNRRISDVHTGLEGRECITPSKRKRDMDDGGPYSSGVNAMKDICTIVDTGSTSPSDCTGNILVETCGICFKQQRVDMEPPQQGICSSGTKPNQELSRGSNKVEYMNLSAVFSCYSSSKPYTKQDELSADLVLNYEENSQTTCLVCNFRGELLCCDGKQCKSSYHISCVDPPMSDAPVEVWNCSACVQKNVESRIHSISDEPESFGRAKNMKLSDANDSSGFIEYWVPVEISNVQRELYCKKLLLNPSLLHFSSSKDLAGALHDLLRSTRKCCDHPYIEESSLQEKVVEFEGLQAIDTFEVRKKALLDAGIKASGKLQLLDMMLMEIKNQGLRAIILFQAIGGVGILIGDILDDFLRQRFGENSYERVEQGVVPSKKAEAMDKFNNKENGRFVFLLETHACRPSIKLSSVDTVIIFGSDWNPVNDVRALQKISIDSQFEQIKIFRLYSTCTIEEKVLMLAKEEKILDSSLINISKNNCQLLLSWGAPYQFVKLNEFHENNSPVSSVTHPKDVVQEFVSLLPQDAKKSGFSGFPVISKAHQTGGGYHTKSILFGEMKRQHMGDGKPLSVWLKLWEGKHPQWKYCVGQSQRNRKRTINTDELSKKPQNESDEAARKRKKVTNIKPGFEERSSPMSKDGASGSQADYVPRFSTSLPASVDGKSISAIPESHNSGDRRKVLDSQSLHLHLKHKISTLCGILQFSGGHKDWVKRFLEYVVKNHNVKTEPETILQAFQISVCWTVASFLKLKIDHKESLALAKRYLNFNCQKEEVDRVYSMLRCLRKTFLYCTGNFKAADSSNLSEISNEGIAVNGVRSGGEDYRTYLVKKDLAKCISEIQKKFEKKTKKLVEKQSEERSRVLKFHELEKEKLESKHKLELAVNPVSADRLTMMEAGFEKEIKEHKYRVDIQLRALEKLQLEARFKLKEKENQLVEEVRNWVCNELLNQSHINIPDEIVAATGVKTPTGPIDSNDTLDPVNSEFFRESGKHKKGTSGDYQANNGGTMENGDVHGFCSSEAVNFGIPSSEESIYKPDKSPICDRDLILDNLATVRSTDGPRTHSDTEQYPHGAALSMPIGEAQLELHETVISNHFVHNVGSVSPGDFGGQIRVVTENIPGVKVESATIATVGANDVLGNLLSRVPPSSDQLVAENPTEIRNTELTEVLVNASTVTTGFNQPNGIDTELSSIGQLVSTTESKQADHELATNEFEGSSSGTPGHSLAQVSSACGTYEIQPCSENRVQETVLTTSSTGNDGHTQAREKHITCIPVENSALQNAVIRTSDDEDSVLQLSERNELTSACAVENQENVIQLVTSAVVQDGDGRGTKNQITCQSVQNSLSQSVAILESNHEVPNSTLLLQQQLPPESAADGNEVQPRRENHTSNQCSQAPVQLMETYSDRSTENVLQPGTSCSLHQPIDRPTNGVGLPFSDTLAVLVMNSRPIHSATQGTLRMPQYSYPDPLQDELERLKKEMEQKIKSHEDKKLHLNFDYEKKIEAAVAELRRERDMKLQMEEAEFQHKKKEFDSCYNKVSMNKNLAQAFRSKCLDLRASNASGLQQDGNSGFVQQLVQLSMQQNAQMPLVSSTSSTSLPASSLQTSRVPSLYTTRPPSAIAPSQHYTPSIMQTVPLPPTSPSVPARSPHIGTISGPTGIPQGGSQIRAPAPHLQSFRPSTSIAGISSRSQHGGLSNSHSHNSLSTSPSVPGTSQMPPPTQQTVPSSGVQHDASAGCGRASSSASTLKLLMDMEQRSRAIQQLPVIYSSNHPGPVPTSASDNPVNAGGPQDVVCLSDDE